MYVDEIASAASEMSGTAAKDLMTFAAAADAEILSRLRTDADTEAGHTAIVTAGAFITLYSFYTVKKSDGITSYSAGEVSVTYKGDSGSSKNVENLRVMAESLLSQYVCDPGFAFKGVDG